MYNTLNFNRSVEISQKNTEPSGYQSTLKPQFFKNQNKFDSTPISVNFGLPSFFNENLDRCFRILFNHYSYVITKVRILNF